MVWRRLLLIFSPFLILACLTAMLVQTVENKPDGVPRALVPQYRARLAKLEADQDKLRQLDRESHPKAVTPKTTFDFGRLAPGDSSSHEFEIRNVGDAPLVLDTSETSCKCTVANASGGPILPGESAAITVQWNTGRKDRNYEQTARIRTNDPLRPQIDLVVRGEILAELVTPANVAFGAVDPGHIKEASFVVYSQLLDEFELVSAESDLPAFSWSVQPIDPSELIQQDADARWAWKVTITTAAPGKKAFEMPVTLTFHQPGETSPVQRVVMAAGRVRSPINFYSPDIHMHRGMEIGVLHNDTRHEFHLTVRDRGTGERQIEVLDVEPKLIETELKATRRDREYRLTFSVPEGSDPLVFNRDNFHGYVKVGDRNDPDYSNWFPVYGAVVSPN